MAAENELIFISDEMAWDAVLRAGVEELTEAEARAAFARQGIEIDEDGVFERQAFLEGDASKSEYDRVFYPVDEHGHANAFIGWMST